MKISRTGLLCLVVFGSSILVHAQAPQDAAAAPADQQPAAPQAPAQQQPAPPQQPAPETTTVQPETRRLKLPPRAAQRRGRPHAGRGWLEYRTYRLAAHRQYLHRQGHAADFTGASKLQLAGKSKGAPGAEIGIAAGLHNSIRISYFNSKLSGTTTAPNDLVIFSQGYLKGDQLTTNAKLSDYKISYEYLTWPYPVGGRHFRLKTLWQVQYITMKTIFDAPIKSSTPDSSGAYTDYSTIGSKSYITPAFGLGFHEYATRNFRLEANLSGFWLPHRFNLVDSDATMAYRAGHFELRAGAKAFVFRTSPKADYFYRGTTGGVFVGVRWYSD